MSATNDNTATHSSSAEQIALDSLYSRPAFITNLNGFLAEKNTYKALAFWLAEFENTRKITSSQDISTAIFRSISVIDELINDQLNCIIHDSKLQKLEASWRGLWHLVNQADGNRDIKIRYLDISWAEVVKDIERALDFDQSNLFQKIYSDEYGTPGGEPYGVIIGDYDISHKRSPNHPYDDISTLNGIADIAAAAFSPFIAAASHEIFGIDDFATLGLPLNLHSIFSQVEYTAWRALRNKSDSRFVGLTLPRVLMRTAYRTKPGSYKGIYFYEKNEGANNNGYLWGNACYAFAGILIREFANVGWFGHIRGVPRDQIGGGILSNFENATFETDSINIALKPLTDVLITDSLERELSDLGFISLCQCYDSPYGAFYSNQSIQYHNRTGANEINAKLSSMLQHVLCASRVAHYIKVMIRDKIGSFITAEECEHFLTKWLFKYTTGREDLEWDEQARYPLREASVKVNEHPDKPGQYLCVIQLAPHYQLDNMVSELELVTELVQTGKIV